VSVNSSNESRLVRLRGEADLSQIWDLQEGVCFTFGAESIKLRPALLEQKVKNQRELEMSRPPEPNGQEGELASR
jgi:hypothetical protein